MFKKLINRIYNPRGYELKRIGCTSSMEQRRVFMGAEPKMIFDVGGHFGETVKEYKRLFPNSTIYSFEPFGASFVELQLTAAKFLNVHAVNLGLSDRAGMVEFNANVGCATNSLLPVDPESTRAWAKLVEPKDKTTIRTETLDGFCETHGIDSIDLLKIDVQGAEPLVLRGAEKMLRRGAVKVVYTEIITMPCYTGQAELHEFLGMMRGYSFELFNLYNMWPTEQGQLKQCDAIFIREPAKASSTYVGRAA